MKAIILAAGIGKRIRKFTTEPKCLIKIKGEPLIIRTIKFLLESDIRDITVVVGYKAEKVTNEIKKHRLKLAIVRNNDFARGSILSLWSGIKSAEKGILIIDGDIYFEKNMLSKIVNSRKNNFFLIDSAMKKNSEAVMVGFMNNRAVRIERGLEGAFPVLGEWAGFLRLSGKGTKVLKRHIKEKLSKGEKGIGYEFIVPDIFKEIKISYELTNGLKWVEIDFPEDVRRAKALNLE